MKWQVIIHDKSYYMLEMAQVGKRLFDVIITKGGTQKRFFGLNPMEVITKLPACYVTYGNIKKLLAMCE